ncbi:hypothetical protein D3C74_329050 [compost metagenome]
MNSYLKQMKPFIALLSLIFSVVGYAKNYGEETFLRYFFVVIIALSGGYLVRNINWKNDDKENKNKS